MGDNEVGGNDSCGDDGTMEAGARIGEAVTVQGARTREDGKKKGTSSWNVKSVEVMY